MKTIKTNFLLVLFLSFTISVSQAQQMYQVHQDNVKPSMIMEYEKIAKEFHEACIEHNLQATWFTAMSNDFKYYYITPIENFAELDQRPFADMAEAMGDKFGEFFNRFDKCYDSHGSYTMFKDDELSYTPENEADTAEDENFRKWFLIYYKPEHGDNVREGMKAVKELYKSKDSKGYYRVYRNGFGQMESYYMVSISAKDEVDYAQKSKTYEKELGTFEERWSAISQVMDFAIRMEEFSGEMRPDLSYSPKKE